MNSSTYTAILGEQGTMGIRVEAFVNMREPTDLLHQNYFNQFFDWLLPCVAGKKVWTSKDKMASSITDGSKITVTDEALLSYAS
jgi:hypothetical protein